MKHKIGALFILVLVAISLHATSLRVEINDLKNNFTKYKILDVRDAKAFQKGHIQGALNFPVTFTYENLQIDGKIATPKRLQENLRSLGLDVNDDIVVYDNGEFFDASRVFWTLEVYGFKNVKLLNAGYDHWSQKNFPISTEIINVTRSNYIASINYKRLSTKFTTQIATKNPNHIIVDARANESYIGKKSLAKRFGHIPKAVNIPAIHNINVQNQASRLKDIDNLKDLYKDVNKDKKVIIYCAIGRVASTNYFALRELGYDVANYDASWREWGNDFNLPIRNRSKEQ